MTVRVMVFAALVVGLATQAQAQTHPCDQAPPASSTIQSGAPYKVTFCAPATDNIEAAVAWVDSVAFDLLPVSALSGPSSTGLVLYATSSFLQVPKGAHSLVVATYNRDILTGQLQFGAQSLPFLFGAVDSTPLPTAPVVKGLAK